MENFSRRDKPIKITPRVHQRFIQEVIEEPRTSEASQAWFQLRPDKVSVMVKEKAKMAPMGKFYNTKAHVVFSKKKKKQLDDPQ